MDGSLSRFTPELRKMRSIKSQWQMWKPMGRPPTRTVCRKPAEEREERGNAAQE